MSSTSLDVEQLKLSCIAVRMQSETAILENSLTVSYKVKYVYIYHTT